MFLLKKRLWLLSVFCLSVYFLLSSWKGGRVETMFPLPLGPLYVLALPFCLWFSGDCKIVQNTRVYYSVLLQVIERFKRRMRHMEIHSHCAVGSQNHKPSALHLGEPSLIASTFSVIRFIWKMVSSVLEQVHALYLWLDAHFLIFVSFLSTPHKSESPKKTEAHLRNCFPQISLFVCLFLGHFLHYNDDTEGIPLCAMPPLVVLGILRKQAQQAMNCDLCSSSSF